MKRTSRATRSKAVVTKDNFQNLAARVGLGAGSVQDASRYAFSPVSRNRVQMEFVYRSSWIAGQAVDVYAEDMTREGIELKGKIDPDDMERIGKAASRLQIWDALCDTIKWARLYGGAVGVLLVDGQKPDTPLRLDAVGKGQFKGILPLDRWVVQPTLENLITEFGPDMGKPKFYDVISDAQALVTQRIHHSRVIRMDGVDLPYWQRIAENGWGQSILERLWDRLVAFDSTTEGVAQLVYKAHLRTYSVENLRELIATGGRMYEALIKQIELIRLYQSNEGMTLMDAKDKYEAHQFSFAGLPDVLLQFGQQISGATGIPLVRLFGQSPAGLNSTGESDIRNYYDNVKQAQERRLRTGVGTVYDLLHRSELGRPPPESFDFDFRALWQMSDTEKADVATKIATAIVGASDAGIIDRATALKELRQSSQITGVFSNVTDDDIKAAEEELPPAPEGMPDENANPGSGAPTGKTDPDPES